MNDTEILDWISRFSCTIKAYTDNTTTVVWYDYKNKRHATSGVNLRDAVIGAKLEQKKLINI